MFLIYIYIYKFWYIISKYELFYLLHYLNISFGNSWLVIIENFSFILFYFLKYTKGFYNNYISKLLLIIIFQRYKSIYIIIFSYKLY